jgi:outer membrane protein assembly factor BamA
MLKYILAFLLITGGMIYPQTDTLNITGTEEEEYLIFEGQIIRNITFRILEVSGPDVDEKNGEDTSWFASFANSLHYKTRPWVIRSYLLFKEGDVLNAYDISESERILRESDFLLDARIIVEKTEFRDSVDIVVTTKDRWTFLLQLSFNAQKNSYAGFRDENLLGLGHELDATITHDNNFLIGWGYNIMYTGKNVGGSFIDAAAGIETNKKYSLKTLDFARTFVSLNTRWAGGLGFVWAENNLFNINQDTSYLTPYTNNSIDAWAGYSFPVFFGSSGFRNRSNLMVGARANRLNFSRRPYIDLDSNRIFANNQIYLFSTGIINRRFYRDHYINRFGPTEDVPIGGMFTLTGGFENNEFTQRYYTGIDGIYSRRINNLGYFSIQTSIGGFYQERSWEQNAYLFDLLYHSRLISLNDWAVRLFLQNSYLIGNNRFDQEQIYLDNETGLRGYDRFSLQGVSRGLLKMEARFFSPYEPLGFAIGGIIFSDFGLIADRGEQLFNRKLYQSYGTGLRISNESITSAQFEIAVAYRTYSPDRRHGSFAVLFSSSMILGSRSFNFTKPSIINYGEN